MSHSTKRVMVLCLGLVACAEQSSLDQPEVGLKSEALGPCNEMVPANRNVDGVPAYAQCTTVQDGAIYSNNGVDTSNTQTGPDWIKTQYSGGYQCTELAHRYLYFRWKVKWIPNGNAGNWCDTQPPANSGVVQTMTPVHGDIMVLAPGSCGASPDTGHVNVVDTVDMASGKLMNVEQNRAGRNSYNMSCAKCFLHVMANDGTPAPLAGVTQPSAAAGAPAVAGAPATSPPVNGGVGGRPATRPAPAGSGAGLPGTPRTPTGPAGAPAPVVSAQPTAAGTVPAATPAPSMPLTAAGAGGSVASAAGTQSAPAATRQPAPAASSCSVTGVGERSGVRPSLAIAGLWMFVVAAWSFRRRGKRELARAHRVLTS